MHKLPLKKKEAWALLAVLIIIAMAMGALRKCSHTRPAPFATHFSPAGGDTLDVAIALVPSIFEVHGDSLGGEHYERLQAMAARHGIEVKYHPFVDLDAALNSLEAGEYDLVVAALPSTTEYQQRFLMTDPIYLDKAVLVQRKDTATLVTSQLQLAGDTVWVPVGSNYSLSIRNLSHEIGDTIYVLSDNKYSAEHLVVLVAQGKVKQAVVNGKVAEQMAPDYPDIDISTPISFNLFHSWALNRADSTLRDSINAWLAE